MNTDKTIHMLDRKLKRETNGRIIIPLCNARGKEIKISDNPGDVTCDHCQLAMVMSD